MTHSGGKPHTNVGDGSQRYEVRYIGDDGTERVFGWTEDSTGGALVESINAHPGWHSPRVVDRRAGNAEAPK